MGTPIPKKYALSTYGIPELEEGDEALEPRQVGVPGLGTRDLPAQAGSGLGGFSEAGDSEKDLAKLEKGAIAGALNAYAALIKRAVEEAAKEM
jgi:hypothetical protein